MSKLTTLVVPTCTSVAPGATDTPAIHPQENPDLLVREDCGVTNVTVSECPFLCGFVGGPITFCADNFEDRGFPSGSVGCKRCLPICPVAVEKPYIPSVKSKSSISARRTASRPSDKLSTSKSSIKTSTSTPTQSTEPTCTSVAPGATDTPATRREGFSGLRREDGKCGVTNETVAECPNLCGLAGDALRVCSDTFTPFLLGRFGCRRCLPICPVENAYKWNRQ